MAPNVSRRGPDGKLEAASLSTHDDEISDISSIVKKAEQTWLKNEEVLTVLEFFVERHGQVLFPDVASFQPDGGRLFLFSRKKCRAFRNDKHSWRKKNDNKTIKETHEKLKVADKETLNCYYAHSELGDGLQRRCYWILDKQHDDVVMVHYLCSQTSRVVGSSKATPPETVPRARLRPQRAASMRAKFSNLYSSDSEELDRKTNHAKNVAEDENENDLGEPNDSFLEKLPEDFGFPKDFLFEQLPGDLSISQAQISKILQVPSNKVTNLALGIADSPGNKVGSPGEIGATLSPKSDKLKCLPSLQLSDADSLFKNLSRLESLEYLKMVSADFNLSMLSPGELNESQGQEVDALDDAIPKAPSSDGTKVSTIRRVVAPPLASPTPSGFQTLVSQSPGVQGDRKARVNPTKPQDVAGKSKADVARDKADFNLQRRESLLRKVRNMKEGVDTLESSGVEDSEDLINAPILFRSSSHLVGRDHSPEKTAHLLKQMSIDNAGREFVGDLLRNCSVDLRPDPDREEKIEQDAFGSVLLDDGSGDKQ
jgi:hypothetical protein